MKLMRQWIKRRRVRLWEKLPIHVGLKILQMLDDSTLWRNRILNSTFYSSYFNQRGVDVFRNSERITRLAVKGRVFYKLRELKLNEVTQVHLNALSCESFPSLETISISYFSLDGAEAVVLKHCGIRRFETRDQSYGLLDHEIITVLGAYPHLTEAKFTLE